VRCRRQTNVAASGHVGMQHSVAVDVVLRLQLAVLHVYPGYSTGDVDSARDQPAWEHPHRR
jgi:hypothetical protein